MAASELKSTSVLKGIGVSPGIISGKAYVLDRGDIQTPHYSLVDDVQVQEELERFEKALKNSEEELCTIKSGLSEQHGIGPLFVDIHIMLLKDRSFLNMTRDNIQRLSVNAERALILTLRTYREIFSKMEDEYLKGRIKDVEDVVQRILWNLVERKPENISDIQEPVIIIAKDLSPADTVQMKVDKILGFATDIGGKTSHTAIVAKSIGIPAVVGLEKITFEVQTNDTVVIDGTAGVVIVNPDPEILKRYDEKKRHYLVLEESLLKDACLPALTKDHYCIGVGANIEFMEEIPSAVAHGANGVGLYRTEFLYVNKERLPTEEEHFENYKNVVTGQGIKWATIRTFDLGGDKFISDPRLAEEMNPAMGLRAIRFCLQEVELFKVQLRAILRASVYGNTGILIPMVSGVQEIRDVKKIIGTVKEELTGKGIPIDEDIKIGIMIEVPAAVMMADALAREVDFFSIGTNDLIQYVLAIDRVNERVTYLYKPLHPAVLRLIQRVVDAAHCAGIKVAMCGEMAGEPLYTMILLGLELDSLSMTPLAIPRVKKIIRNSTLQESKALMNKVMTFATADEIEKYVTDYMKKRFPEEFPMNLD